MENFGEKLKKALKEKNLTQGELCEKIGMTPNGLKRMIDLGTTRVDTLESICRVLDVPITYFIDVDVKPIGFFKQMLDEATQETNKWKIEYYMLREQMQMKGNFPNVSGKRGVFNVTKNRKPVFLVANYLRFHLHN